MWTLSRWAPKCNFFGKIRKKISHNLKMDTKIDKKFRTQNFEKKNRFFQNFFFLLEKVPGSSCIDMRSPRPLWIIRQHYIATGRVVFRSGCRRFGERLRGWGGERIPAERTGDRSGENRGKPERIQRQAIPVEARPVGALDSGDGRLRGRKSSGCFESHTVFVVVIIPAPRLRSG